MANSTVAMLALCLLVTLATLPMTSFLLPSRAGSDLQTSSLRPVLSPKLSAERGQDPRMETSLSGFGLAAAAAAVGLLFGVVGLPDTAAARPWPVEEDGMQIFSSVPRGQDRDHPLMTDRERQDLHEALLPQTHAELAHDWELRQAALPTPEKKSQRVSETTAALRELAQEVELPA